MDFYYLSFQMNFCRPVYRGWCQGGEINLFPIKQLAGGCCYLYWSYLYTFERILVDVEYFIICSAGWGGWRDYLLF